MLFPDLWLRRIIRLIPAALLAQLMLCLQTVAFESYHDPNQNDQGYCSDCHPGFKAGRNDTLHALHTGGGDPITTNCDLCHTGSGRDNPLTLWSAADGDTGLGCAGCHGRDYGETVENDHRGFSTQGRPKNSGWGLRRHHASVGITTCANCHDDGEPLPENVMNPGLGNTTHYFFRSDVSLGGSPMDTCVNEDTANDADGIGLDNDGDGLYDENDPDCSPDPLMLSIETQPANELLIRWPAPTQGWRLQSATDLTGQDWQDQPAPTERLMGLWQFVVSPSLGLPRFYRLVK
jgi:hypothetical protein